MARECCKLDSRGQSGGEKLREDALRDRETHFHKHVHPAGQPRKGELTSGGAGRNFEMKEGKN
jgi:hypothetical protein